MDGSHQQLITAEATEHLQHTAVNDVHCIFAILKAHCKDLKTFQEGTGHETTYRV